MQNMFGDGFTTMKRISLYCAFNHLVGIWPWISGSQLGQLCCAETLDTSRDIPAVITGKECAVGIQGAKRVLNKHLKIHRTVSTIKGSFSPKSQQCWDEKLPYTNSVTPLNVCVSNLKSKRIPAE
jgi:hypothetical protein